jgi:hypothetical protein
VPPVTTLEELLSHFARTGFTVHTDRLTPSGGVCPDCQTHIPGRWR